MRWKQNAGVIRILSRSFMQLLGYLFLGFGVLWTGIAYYSFGFCYSDCNGFASPNQLAQFGDYLSGTTGLLWAAASIFFVASALLYQAHSTNVASLDPLVENFRIHYQALTDRNDGSADLKIVLVQAEEIRLALHEYYMQRDALAGWLASQEKESKKLSTVRPMSKVARSPIVSKKAEIGSKLLRLSHELAPFFHFLFDILDEVRGRFPGRADASRYFRIAILSSVPPVHLVTILVVAGMSRNREDKNLRFVVSEIEKSVSEYFPSRIKGRVSSWDLFFAMRGIIRGRKAQGGPPFRKFGGESSSMLKALKKWFQRFGSLKRSSGASSQIKARKDIPSQTPPPPSGRPSG